MKITIEVPEFKCTKCAATAPIQPHLLYFKGQVPEQMREAFSDVLKHRPDVTAADDAGHSWGVLADEKPLGWVKGPQASDLCAKCGAAWLVAGKAFLVTPPPMIVVAPKVDLATVVVPKPEIATGVAKPKMTPLMAKVALMTQALPKGATPVKKPSRALSATDPGFNYGAKKATANTPVVVAPKAPTGSGVLSPATAVPTRALVPPAVTGLQ